MEEIQALTKKDGSLIVGFVEETERFYVVTGMYLHGELTNDIYNNADAKLSVQYKPFSQVGSAVQTMKFPRANIEGYSVLPKSMIFHLTNLIRAEARNGKRKDHLNGMRVQSRAGMSPEETLALQSQYIEENKALPSGNHFTQDMGSIAGTFKVVPTSPYRED